MQAAQDERLWQRLINIANHRHVKTSKGWIDIAHAKTSGKGQATAPLNHKHIPINEADKAEMAAHPDVFQYGQWMHWVPGHGAYTAFGNDFVWTHRVFILPLFSLVITAKAQTFSFF